ncbi:hypothetical protein ACHAO9_000012 [Fusarium lateritium]
MVPKKGAFQRLSEHLWRVRQPNFREPSTPQLPNPQELQVLQQPKQPLTTLMSQTSGTQEPQAPQDHDEIQELQEPQEPQHSQEPQEPQGPEESHNSNENEEVQAPHEPQQSRFARRTARLVRTVFSHRTPAVHIGNTETERGRGLFANRTFTRYKTIIEELPILTSSHSLLRADWSLATLEKRREVAGLFTRLANIPTDRALTANEPSGMIIEDFRTEYAFQDPARQRALIYRLASHMNHACTDCANAMWIVDAREPHGITVQTTKRVKAGKEIFINYGWANLSFACPICAKKRVKRAAKQARKEDFKRKLKRFARLFDLPQIRCLGGSHHSVHSGDSWE